MVKDKLLEAPPLDAGFSTVTGTVPLVVSRVAGMVSRELRGAHDRSDEGGGTERDGCSSDERLAGNRERRIRAPTWEARR